MLQLTHIGSVPNLISQWKHWSLSLSLNLTNGISQLIIAELPYIHQIQKRSLGTQVQTGGPQSREAAVGVNMNIQ